MPGACFSSQSTAQAAPPPASAPQVAPSPAAATTMATKKVGWEWNRSERPAPPDIKPVAVPEAGGLLGHLEMRYCFTFTIYLYVGVCNMAL